MGRHNFLYVSEDTGISTFFLLHDKMYSQHIQFSKQILNRSAKFWLQSCQFMIFKKIWLPTFQFLTNTMFF